ncbi:unnamed protein product [Rotaria magnacalcarata]|uniref:Homeobox domain-containing protein n=1 Tax=Rotaria magnacalcarata TaxID=392030 RepID=A0A815PCS9_9BILA|nr:unnamed protein product [Rotaria magnacalcarata]
MDYYYTSCEFFTQCATEITNVEKKLTDEQVQYLHEYYTMNQIPEPIEIDAIAKHWNIDDFDLSNWFFSRYMIDRAVEQRRFEAKRIAA